MVRTYNMALVALVAIALAGTAASATLRPVDTLQADGSGSSTGGEVISSEVQGSLERPEQWDCKRIAPDYRRWLADGKAAENWKYVGHTYRDTQTNKLYDWQDWLDWADGAGCLAGPVGETAGMPTSAVVVGASIAALGTGLLVATSGGSAKSPG